jgi:hypothetical protein
MQVGHPEVSPEQPIPQTLHLVEINDTAGSLPPTETQ